MVDWTRAFRTVTLGGSVASGVGVACWARAEPQAVYHLAILVGLSLLALSGVGFCAALATRRRAAALDAQVVATAASVRAQGTAYWWWFSAHNLIWAGSLLLGAALFLWVAGPQVTPLLMVAALVACAVFAVVGLLGRGPVALLGLCWGQPVPGAWDRPFAVAHAAVGLWPRFAAVKKAGTRAARQQGRQADLTRFQVAIEIDTAPRIDFGPPGLRSEISGRLRGFVPIALLAMLMMLVLTLANALIPRENPLADGDPGPPTRRAGETAAEGAQDPADGSSPAETPRESGLSGGLSDGGPQEDTPWPDEPAGDGTRQSAGTSPDDLAQGGMQRDRPPGEGSRNGEPEEAEGRKSGFSAGDRDGSEDGGSRQDRADGDEPRSEGSPGKAAGSSRSAASPGSSAEILRPAADAAPLALPPTDGEILVVHLPDHGTAQAVPTSDSTPETAPAEPAGSEPGAVSGPPPAADRSTPQEAKQPFPAWIARLLRGTVGGEP